MAYEFFGGKNTVVDLSKRRVFSFTTGSPEPLKKVGSEVGYSRDVRVVGRWRLTARRCQRDLLIASRAIEHLVVHQSKC
jgi:hypothetical protein